MLKFTKSTFPLLLVSVVLSACSHKADWREAQGVVWSTTYHITYYADHDLSDSITATMRRVELSLSPFDASSLISGINRGDTGHTDSLIRKVFYRSQEVNAASGGSFDPTVGPLVELWGFGTKRDSMAYPSDSVIQDALELVGIAECSITDGGIIAKKHPDTMFNFSAITKGLGCDEVGAMLSRNSVENYLVEIGGEIALKGTNRRGEKWHIAIDMPDRESGKPNHEGLATVSLTDCGVATSGNYRNWHDSSNGPVGHTISPLTGYPVEKGILSATVIAPDCMTADALATACMTLTPKDAIAMIEAWPEAEALLVLPGTPLRTVASHGFPLPKN